ncbi:hypothetical protein AYO47_07615 [Planctomyces sp. SCGC AG-212-M04]|nr:hypothetical protein AYO47_07615 [Planctomyces sp. SCGC AG-212-M04]
MQPTGGKPPKKRRRWLIVAFGLVLMSLVFWWYWPRGDARFVGKWEMYLYRGTEPILDIDFKRNGTCYVRTPGVEGVSVQSWDTNDSRLTFGPVGSPPIAFLLSKVSPVIEKLTGYDFMGGSRATYELPSLARDSVTLRSIKTKRIYEYTLRRKEK